MPRPSDPQARARLLASARKVFVEKGLDRAKVEDITQAAALSKGSFYLHFDSKEQAFTEILEESLGEVEKNVTESMELGRASFDDGLEAMIRGWLERDIAIFEVVWKHRAIMALVLLEGGGSSTYVHLTETFVGRIQAQLASLLEFGIERGYYRKSIDPVVASAFCSGGFDRIARRMLRDKKKPDFRELLKKAHLYVAHALGSPEFVRLADEIHGSDGEPVSRVQPDARAKKTRSA